MMREEDCVSHQVLLTKWSKWTLELNAAPHSKNTNMCIILILHIMKVRDVQFTIGTIFDQWQNIERNRSRKWVLICCRAYNFSIWFRWRVLLYQHFISIDVDWQRNLYGFEHSVPKVSLTTKLEVKALIRVRGKEATRTIARAMKFQRQVVMNHISTGLFFNRWMKHTRSWTMVLYFKFTILNPHSRKYLQLSMIMMSMKTLHEHFDTRETIAPVTTNGILLMRSNKFKIKGHWKNELLNRGLKF